MNASYQVQQRIPDFFRYEIKDHLGNVRTVIAGDSPLFKED